MKVFQTHPAIAHKSELFHLFNMDKLFEPEQRKEFTNDGFTVKVLTQTGRDAVKSAVLYCLKNGVAPNCSVGSDDGRCNGDIHGLNTFEYDDLIEKLEYIANHS